MFKRYCTKHSLYHGHKYPSCTPKPKLKSGIIEAKRYKEYLDKKEIQQVVYELSEVTAEVLREEEIIQRAQTQLATFLPVQKFLKNYLYVRKKKEAKIG